jgi:hypothetical protein
MSHVFTSLQSLLHGQEIAGQKASLPEWSDLGEVVQALPLPPHDNCPPSALITGGGAAFAVPGTPGGGPGPAAMRLGPHAPPSTAGLGVSGHACMVAASLDTGLSLTPLPADRVATTILFKPGVLSLKGDRPDDIQERTAAKANAILTGTYAGEGDDAM